MASEKIEVFAVHHTESIIIINTKIKQILPDQVFTMLLRFFLPALLFVVGLALCAPTDGRRPMTMYQDECKMQESKKSPVWQATTHHPGKNPVTWADASLVVRQHYNWVSQQDKFCTGTDTCLVAVFADPVNNKFYASTIPRGPKLDAMREEGAEKAPVWHKVVGNDRYDAEDGAYFNWESLQHGEIKNGKYPDGSVIAVWDKYSDKTGAGEAWPCMGNKTNKKKGCRQVAQELGVQWTKMKPENNDNENKRKKRLARRLGAIVAAGSSRQFFCGLYVR